MAPITRYAARNGTGSIMKINANGLKQEILLPSSMLTKKERKSRLEDITASALNLEKKKGKSSGLKAAVLLCKFMQCILWDAGFRHTMMKFQFEALLALAGIDMMALLDILIKWNTSRQSLLVCQSKKGQNIRIHLCKSAILFVDTKGVLLADAIGTGRTIEGIGAAILRSYICRVQGVPSLPTLIVTPNAAFLNQWEKALVDSGVPPSNVVRFARDDQKELHRDDCFILLSRHSLMAETRHVLKGRGSNLFPFLPHDLIDLLQDTRMRGEGNVDEIRIALGNHSKTIARKQFRTLIIDESHVFRNLLTFAGVGTALLGTVAERTVPMTCTPFISSTGDLATLMVFIDPTMPASHKGWWKEATKQIADKNVIEKVKLWRNCYIIRRDQTFLRNGLTVKAETVLSVQCFEPELTVYKRYEQSFIALFEGYINSTDPDLSLGKKDLTDVLLLYLINMRMSLIHPLIPKGREFTIRFSPSRRHLEAKLSQTLCVCCATESDGKLVPVPSNMCYTAGSPSPHYIHKPCLEFLQHKDSSECPRCADLAKRSSMHSSVPHPSYCTNIQVLPGVSGFKSTAKIEKVLCWAKSVPKDDKGIIFSFFEGALDLIEGALTEDLGINCARLDIDLGPEEQAADLLRFKESPDCQFLLTTVQSCGSGLNIEEANHIAFLDRWFDTSVHHQAINRCHNINQTKPVSVVYFDAAITVDEVMKSINDSMSEHASITLADGTVIGAQQRKIRFPDVSGPIYRMIKAVSKERAEFLLANPGSPISPRQDMLPFITQKDELLPQPRKLFPSSILKARSSGKVRKTNSVRRVMFAPLSQNETSQPNIQSYHGHQIPSHHTTFQRVPIVDQHHLYPLSRSQMAFYPYVQSSLHSAGHGTPQQVFYNNINEAHHCFRLQHVNHNDGKHVELSNQGSYSTRAET